MKMKLRSSLKYCAVIAALVGGAPAQAETLTDTLIKAYQLSPLLEANRHALHSLDENVAQARSGLRPTLSLGGSAVYDYDHDTGDRTDDYQLKLRATLRLYDGGNTRAAIEAAKISVLAGRTQLVDVEQNILLRAVTAYMDVRRDAEFVSLRNSNVRVLKQQVRAANDRFELGEVTRTDVSLAEARLAAAHSGLAAATGSHEASKEQFLAVVGVPSVNLQAPPSIPQLPPSLTQATAIAMREHPSLNAARFSVTGAEWDLVRAKAAGRPTLDVSANAGFNRRSNPAPRDGNGDLIPGRGQRSIFENGSAGLRVEGNIPIYQGGRNSSLIRQADAFLSQRKYEVQNEARTIKQNVGLAWSQLAVARASIVANREQVAAARIAFEGVREEATLGARTTLDVLDREQELRDAQVELAASIRDEYVAAYELLSSMGLLTVGHLNLGIPVYNPEVNYQAVQHGPVTTPQGLKLDRIFGRYKD